MEKGAESSPGRGVFQASQEGPETLESHFNPGTRREMAIALLGGAFDPPHHGHLAIAEAAVRFLPVDEVVFLIAGSPPHKRGTTASSQQRLTMLRAALAGRPPFRVDARELERPGPTYLVDTLRDFRDASPTPTIYFLVGIDAARSMKQWRGAEEIFELCLPVPVPRPGFGARIRQQDVPFLGREDLEALNHRALPEPSMDVSSSAIRQLVRSEKRVAAAKGLVPPAVLDIMEAQGLYLPS